jgi:hypothetical protein
MPEFSNYTLPELLVIWMLAFTPLDKRFKFLINPDTFLLIRKVMILSILISYLTG